MPSEELHRQVLQQMRAGRHCAEAVVQVILENAGHPDPQPALLAASAFGGGIAGSTLDLCGAFSGGVIALGSLWGRSQPGVELKQCAQLVRELRRRFLEEFGSLQCRPLLDAQADSEAQVPSCVQITASATALLGDVLAEQIPSWRAAPLSQPVVPSPTLTPGQCPFGDCGC